MSGGSVCRVGAYVGWERMSGGSVCPVGAYVGWERMSGGSVCRVRVRRAWHSIAPIEGAMGPRRAPQRGSGAVARTPRRRSPGTRCSALIGPARAPRRCGGPPRAPHLPDNTRRVMRARALDSKVRWRPADQARGG
eukprot:240046-Prorocentrum_minimum.AAC.3